MQSLFEEPVENTQQEEIDLFLPVCEKYLEEHPIPTIKPNPLVFAQEYLAQRPGMEWLNSVQCIMIAPVDRDSDKQRQQLEEFFVRLNSEAQYLPPDFPALQEHNFPGSKFLSLDTETTGLDTRVLYDYDGNIVPKTKLVSITIATSDTVSYYLPIMHTEEDGILNFNKEVITEFIQKVVNNFLLIFHNAQYDKEVLAINGIETRKFPFFLDTMLLHFLSEVNVKNHGLKWVSEQMLGRKMIEISQLFTEMGVKTKMHINFDKLPAVNSTVYACADALNTMGLFLQFAQMPNERNVFIQQPVPLAIDHKMSDVLRNMYRSGFPVNLDYALDSCKDIIYRLQLLEKQLYEFVGRKFDIQSPQQVSKLLFDEWKIPVLEGMVRGKPTKSDPQGLYSTAADILDELFKKHPEIKLLEYIVNYRQLSHTITNVFSKLITNSYVDAFQPFTRSQAQYSQVVIPSGRLASSSNNGREGVKASLTKTGNITYKYDKGAWSAGINTQGVAKPDKKQAEAKRICKLPPSAGINIENPYPPEVELELVKLLAEV